MANELVTIDPAQMARLDDLATTCKAIDVNAGAFTGPLLMAAAVQEMRHLLTDQVMQSVMSLQGSPIGFKTDKDLVKDKQTRKYTKGPGYPIGVVRDVVIWAASMGVRMVGNECNIISGRGYGTKEHFFRALNDKLGSAGWRLTHDVPRNGNGGAVVKTSVKWMADGAWQDQELEHAIKGDTYSSSDQYRGKADRKCAKWLWEQVSGLAYADGDADEVVTEVNAIPTKAEAAPAPPAAAMAPVTPAEMFQELVERVGRNQMEHFLSITRRPPIDDLDDDAKTAVLATPDLAQQIAHHWTSTVPVGDA